MSYKSLEAWYCKYKELAKQYNCLWLVNEGADNYQDFYDDGISPDEAFQTERYYAKQGG